VAPGQALAREPSVPLPLRERNDVYYPLTPNAEQSSTTISRLRLRVQFLRAALNGLRAEPVSVSKTAARVSGNRNIQDSESLEAELATGPLQRHVRQGRFTRVEP
jgi:hypothetical protein